MSRAHASPTPPSTALAVREPTLPRTHRPEVRALLAGALDSAIVADPVVSAPKMADVLGVAAQVFRRMRGGLSPVNLEKVVEASPRVAARFFRTAAERLEATAPRTPISQAEHVARVMAEVGDFARAVVEAGAEIDDEEADRLDRELTELIEAAQRARADLRASRGRR